MRLIDAEELETKQKTIYMEFDNVAVPTKVIPMSDLYLAPTMDAEPVRHGRWEDNKGAIRCSECKNTPLYDYHGRMVLATRCHVCGAMMRKEVRK